MIKDKKCERSRRERGFPFDFRTIEDRERGGGGGAGEDGEGNEHLFEKIWCYTTVAFSYETFFFRRPTFLSRNGTFLQFNWRYLTSYLHSRTRLVKVYVKSKSI